MAKKNNPLTPSPLFIILVGTSPERWVSSPTTEVTTKLQFAATWDDQALAESFAKTLGGTVMLYPGSAGGKPKLALVPSTLNMQPVADELNAKHADKPVVSDRAEVTTSSEKKPKAKAKAIQAKEPVTPRGPSRELVVAILKASGLQLVQKSSDHYGDPKGSRLVLPKAAVVTRIYLYKTEDDTLLGFKSAEQRKAEGLGAVTHVADISDIGQVEVLMKAVMKANGLETEPTPAAPAPKRRKKTPATGHMILHPKDGV